MSSLSAFQAVRTIGTVLPAEALIRADRPADARPECPETTSSLRAWPSMLPSPVPGMRPWAPTAPGRSPWTGSPERDAATALTRDKWLLPLLYELGYGRPEVLSGGLDLAARPRRDPARSTIPSPISSPGLAADPTLRPRCRYIWSAAASPWTIPPRA